MSYRPVKRVVAVVLAGSVLAWAPLSSSWAVRGVVMWALLVTGAIGFIGSLVQQLVASSMSLTTTRAPSRAKRAAMAAPMVPAPSTATRRMSLVKDAPPGRSAFRGYARSGANPAEGTPAMSERTPASTDFYRIDDLLGDGEREVRDRVRAFCDKEVTPVINDYWERAECPVHLFKPFAELAQFDRLQRPGSDAAQRKLQHVAFAHEGVDEPLQGLLTGGGTRRREPLHGRHHRERQQDQGAVDEEQLEVAGDRGVEKLLWVGAQVLVAVVDRLALRDRGVPDQDQPALPAERGRGDQSRISQCHAHSVDGRAPRGHVRGRSRHGCGRRTAWWRHRAGRVVRGRVPHRRCVVAHGGSSRSPFSSGVRPPRRSISQGSRFIVG